MLGTEDTCRHCAECASRRGSVPWGWAQRDKGDGEGKCRTVNSRLLIQASGNKGPRAGCETTFRVFSKSRFNVFSIKTKRRNTWCLLSKQALVLKINQSGRRDSGPGYFCSQAGPGQWALRATGTSCCPWVGHLQLETITGGHRRRLWPGQGWFSCPAPGLPHVSSLETM